MKRLLVLALLATTAAVAVAQSVTQFQHIIIVIQENRTPDNLFGASGLPGGDLQVNKKLGKAISLSDGPDPGHGHDKFLQEAAGIYILNDYYDYVTSEAGPYWQMAAEYGFANYMYQTSQGPPFPAHLFLVMGTSAPSDTSSSFVSSNAIARTGSEGCKARKSSLVNLINPDGSLSTIFPCFPTASLLDLLAANGLSWHYYVFSGAHGDWNPPGALKKWYKSPNIVPNPPQVLTDIANGNLADVSWVTPAGAYSDHPGKGNNGGPAWVASIVNAVGQSAYWENTAILVTWDDWGGWWDHVPPLANDTGWCTEYCYGFRVPLLVISAQTPPGYVDNGVHDFGSILHFVESNFGLTNIGPGGWADSYADDLSGFFTGGMAHRKFVPIKARKLTKAELADQDEPDNDDNDD